MRILYGKQPADLIGGPFAVYVFDDGRVTASTTGCHAAIGELPAEVASPPRAVDLVRELELAVNELEAFGLATEAQVHRRFLQGVRDSGYVAGPTCMSATESSSSSFASDDSLPGYAEGVVDSDASP